MVLQDQLEVDPEDGDSINTLLEGRVEQMIQRATRQTGQGQAAKLPLIRLKVANCLFDLFNHEKL